ncbi:MAG: MGMT family protein [candidate division Zixibacteria bacterium]
METRRGKEPEAVLLSQRIKDIIKKIPRGKLATYGQIAAMAGNPLAAREVVRILHSSSRKEKLPWHRVINSKGRISLQPGFGYEEQKNLLVKEGIEFADDDTIDFERFLWQP